MKIPVEGHSGFYRDSISGAVLNCNDSEYDNYIRSKELKIKQRQEIENLRNDVNEIKDMMKIILSKLDSNS
jgi:hypothetical protein